MLIECNIFVVEIDSEDKRKGIEIKQLNKMKKRQIVEKYSNAMLLLLFITHIHTYTNGEKKNKYNKRRL